MTSPAGGYDQTVRVGVGVLSVLVLVAWFAFFVQYRQVQNLTEVTCSATNERLGRIDLYRKLIAEERKLMDRAPEKDVFTNRIRAYEYQIVLVQRTITAADFACEPQAGQYLQERNLQ